MAKVKVNVNEVWPFYSLYIPKHVDDVKNCCDVSEEFINEYNKFIVLSREMQSKLCSLYDKLEGILEERSMGMAEVFEE